MESLLSGLSQHGYSILIAVVFLEAMGLPVPAALALLIGGGAAASGSLNPWLAFGGALAAMMTADTLMFLVGRYTGWWLLGMLCRLSLNPESCILRSADSFYRRGRTLLLFAKFVPGINTMAPPLAGSMNMRLSQFWGLDLVGRHILCRRVVRRRISLQRCAGVHYQGLPCLRTGGRVGGARRHRRLSRVSGMDVEEIARAVAGALGASGRSGGALSTESAVIYDVRSHGYYDSKAMRIQGSRRLEPNAIHQNEEELPADKPVYLYCTCIRDATSSRIARDLLEKGVQCAVIEGGLRAWKKAGLPMEPVPTAEVVLLPVFES